MIKSGNNLFETYEKEITCIYGEASTGKTTLAKLAAIEQAKNDKKVIYIDTEDSFSVERVKQLVGEGFEKVLENIILFKPKRFSEQNQTIRALPDMKNISLIIVDTLGHHYRAKVKEKPQVYNMWVSRQLSILKELSKNLPVIFTNQVYSKMDDEGLAMVGGEMVRGWSDRIIKLEKEPRKIVFEKPIEEGRNFEIKSKGLFGLEESENK
jgi:DNA repair protein RadB